MKTYTLDLVMESPSVSIFSPKFKGEEFNEFEKFLTTYKTLTEEPLVNDFNAIVAAIDKIRTIGASENLFRPESKFSGNVCAIPLVIKYRNKKFGTLRLYCSRLSNRILIVGNGSVKKTKTTQEDPILMTHINNLIFIEKDLLSVLAEKKIKIDDFQSVVSLMENLIFQNTEQ